jgi:DNA topoisomerase-2
MDDSLMEDAVFNDGASSDFEPVKPIKAVKATKAKAAPKKTTTTAKPRGRPVKATTQTTLKVTKTAAPKKKKRKDDSDEENSDMELDAVSDHDDSLLADTPPKAKPTKKALAPKKSLKPLAPVENESFGLDGATVTPPKPKGKGSAADRFQMVYEILLLTGPFPLLTTFLAHALGAHCEAPRHLHRLRRAH